MRYYLMATLPALGELGSVPPIGLAELAEHAAESPKMKRLVESVLLADDLMQRDAFMAGEVKEVEPVVLSEEVARNEARLPEYLVSSDTQHDYDAQVDPVWHEYFRHVTELGCREGNGFLPRWAGFEIGLRNRLVEERARRLELDAARYRVATDVIPDEGSVDDCSDAIRRWVAATTPLEGLRELIRVRWEWLDRNERWFSFSEDELLVYAARLLLLEQWQRVNDEATQAAAETADRADL